MRLDLRARRIGIPSKACQIDFWGSMESGEGGVMEVEVLLSLNVVAVAFRMARPRAATMRRWRIIVV